MQDPYQPRSLRDWERAAARSELDSVRRRHEEPLHPDWPRIAVAAVLLLVWGAILATAWLLA